MKVVSTKRAKEMLDLQLRSFARNFRERHAYKSLIEFERDRLREEINAIRIMKMFLEGEECSHYKATVEAYEKSVDTIKRTVKHLKQSLIDTYEDQPSDWTERDWMWLRTNQDELVSAIRCMIGGDEWAIRDSAKKACENFNTYLNRDDEKSSAAYKEYYAWVNSLASEEAKND